jgi:prephenate dehydrogenase
MVGRVAIIGVGLIGGSLGMALRARRLATEVIGVARREETLVDAQRLGAIDRGTLSLVEGVRDADLVVLATPVRTIMEQLAAIGPGLSPGCLVTDAGSTKADIVAAAVCLPETVDFVGGHPMAGSDEAGVAAARADLFQGATWALTPADRSPEDAVTRLETLVRALGSNPLRLSASEHDAIVAVTSHLPHLLAAAIMNVVDAAAQSDVRVEAFAAGGLRSVTRIAQSNPDLWRDILLTNRQAILAAGKRLREEMEALLLAVEQGDAAAIEELLSRAAQARRGLQGGEA